MNKRLLYKPEISVIIPVYHENCICTTIEHVKEISSGYDIEIIIADGDETGSTIDLIKDPDIYKIISPKGRSLQMNKAAEISRGDILLFLHADTFLPENAFYYIKKIMQSGNYAGGAFDLGFDTLSPVFILIAFAASFKHRLTRVPYGDQAIFMTRKKFTELGGFREIAIMEDIDIMKRIKRKGWKINILPYRVKTSSRKWRSEGILYTIVRNCFIQILYFFGVPAKKLAGLYYRHNLEQ